MRFAYYERGFIWIAINALLSVGIRGRSKSYLNSI